MSTSTRPPLADRVTPLILAVEPDPEQAASVRRAVRSLATVDLVLVTSANAAMAELAKAVPQLILLSALLKPSDEAYLAAHLRSREDAPHVEMITIPLLDGLPRREEKKRGLLGVFKRGKSRNDNQGRVSPRAFANELKAHLERIREAQAAAAAKASKIQPVVAAPTSAAESAPADSIVSVTPRRVMLVSEPVPGVRLSDLLARASERAAVADLPATLFVIQRLLSALKSLHAATDLARPPVALERVVITPRAEVFVVTSPLSHYVPGASEADRRIDIAGVAVIAMSMMLGRRLDGTEHVPKRSELLAEVGEVGAIRGGDAFSALLRSWFDRALATDVTASFPGFSNAAFALEQVEHAGCAASRRALKAFLKSLALENFDTPEAFEIEAQRLRSARANQIAKRPAREEPAAWATPEPIAAEPAASAFTWSMPASEPIAEMPPEPPYHPTEAVADVIEAVAPSYLDPGTAIQEAARAQEPSESPNEPYRSIFIKPTDAPVDDAPSIWRVPETDFETDFTSQPVSEPASAFASDSGTYFQPPEAPAAETPSIWREPEPDIESQPTSDPVYAFGSDSSSFVQPETPVAEAPSIWRMPEPAEEIAMDSTAAPPPPSDFFAVPEEPEVVAAPVASVPEPPPPPPVVPDVPAPALADVVAPPVPEDATPSKPRHGLLDLFRSFRARHADTESPVSQVPVRMIAPADITPEPIAPVPVPAEPPSIEAVVASEPPAVFEEPRVDLQEPPAAVAETPAVYSEPPTYYAAPSAVDEEPPAIHEEPSAIEEEPPVFFAEPPAAVVAEPSAPAVTEPEPEEPAYAEPDWPVALPTSEVAATAEHRAPTPDEDVMQEMLRTAISVSRATLGLEPHADVAPPVAEPVVEPEPPAVEPEPPAVKPEPPAAPPARSLLSLFRSFRGRRAEEHQEPTHEPIAPQQVEPTEDVAPVSAAEWAVDEWHESVEPEPVVHQPTMEIAAAAEQALTPATVADTRADHVEHVDDDWEQESAEFMPVEPAATIVAPPPPAAWKEEIAAHPASDPSETMIWEDIERQAEATQATLAAEPAPPLYLETSPATNAPPPLYLETAPTTDAAPPLYLETTAADAAPPTSYVEPAPVAEEPPQLYVETPPATDAAASVYVETPPSHVAPPPFAPPVAIMPPPIAERPKPAVPNVKGPITRRTSVAKRVRRWTQVAAALVVGAVLVSGVRAFYLRTTTPGTLRLESTPKGSQVLVDGTERGTTPLTLQLTAGKHAIELHRNGLTKQFTLEIGAGEDVARRVDWSGVKPVGSLAISSQPSGAKVIVDGKARGVTPMTISELAIGSHTVVLEGKEGSVRRTVTIKAGSEETIDESIFSGWIAVFAPFELKITEGKRVIGTTESGKIIMPAGRHELVLTNATLGYRETRVLEVNPGQTTSVTIEAAEGVVRVNAPAGTEVFIDGQRVGVTPLGDLHVAIGSREIVCKHPQLGQQRFVTDVTRSAPVELNVDFKH